VKNENEKLNRGLNHFPLRLYLAVKSIILAYPISMENESRGTYTDREGSDPNNAFNPSNIYCQKLELLINILP